MGLIIKQQKFCEVDGWYEYEDYDGPDETEVCPFDAGHTTRNHSIIEKEEYTEMFFLPNHDAIYGNFATRSIEANSDDYFVMSIPVCFLELISAEMICISTATITDKNIDIDSKYGAVGEAKDVHSESDSVSVYSFTADEIAVINIAGILSGISAGDFCGIHINHNAIGATIHYICIRLRCKMNNL